MGYTPEMPADDHALKRESIQSKKCHWSLEGSHDNSRPSAAALGNELSASSIATGHRPAAGELVPDRPGNRHDVEIGGTSFGHSNLDRSTMRVEVDESAALEASRESNAARH